MILQIDSKTPPFVNARNQFPIIGNHSRLLQNINIKIKINFKKSFIQQIQLLLYYLIVIRLLYIILFEKIIK